MKRLISILLVAACAVVATGFGRTGFEDAKDEVDKIVQRNLEIVKTRIMGQSIVGTVSEDNFGELAHTVPNVGLIHRVELNVSNKLADLVLKDVKLRLTALRIHLVFHEFGQGDRPVTGGVSGIDVSVGDLAPGQTKLVKVYFKAKQTFDVQGLQAILVKWADVSRGVHSGTL